MSWRILSVSTRALACIISLILSSCTSLEPSRHAISPQPTRPEALQPAGLPAQAENLRRHRLQVRELMIPQADVDRYPDLQDSRVGDGLSRLLVNVLTEMQRFDLTVPPDELSQHLRQTWASGPMGLKMHTTPGEATQSKAFQLSVKIFDISTCQPIYQRASAGLNASCRSSVGAQVQIEAPSGQFVPGATHPLAPQGRYVHSDHLTLLGTSDVAFSQSAVGMATAKAIQYALLQALERLDRQGW